MTTAKRLTSLFIALCLHIDVTHANSAASCRRYQGKNANIEILNAIGAGKARLLVSCGIDIDRPVPFGGKAITPLQLVATMDRPDLIDELVTLGADPNFAGDDEIELYPLELALSRKKYRSAIALLRNKARADYALPHSGMTALMALTFDNDFDSTAARTMKDLIARGADINATDMNGDSPLHWASRAGNVKYVSELLQAKADACALNKQGKKPIELIRKPDAELQTMLQPACRR